MRAVVMDVLHAYCRLGVGVDIGGVGVGLDKRGSRDETRLANHELQ